MVVRFNKMALFFVFIFMILSSITFAEEPDKYKVQALSVIKKEFTVSLMELEEAMGKCVEEERKSNLNASHFKGINISHKEMMTALFYFNAKANLECITKAKYKNLAYALLKYQRTLQSQNEDLEIPPSSYFSPGTDEAFEIMYNEISLKYRVGLEKIPELSKPFDVSKVLKEIELDVYGIKSKY
jgi:hypothetical protein